MKRLDKNIELALYEIHEYQNSDHLNLCVKTIKEIAKSYFFKGKLDTFVLFLSQPFNTNDEVFLSLEYALKEYLKANQEFIQKMHFILEKDRKEQNLSNDLQGILTQLDYQHLLPMIKMFVK
jgi:hypothetical protein